MLKKLGFTAILAGALLLSSCGKKLGQFSSDYFTTNPNPLEVVGTKVPATVTANIPGNFFVKNATVVVTPYLVYSGTETPSQAYAFQGEKVNGNAPVINYANGGVVTIPVQFAYDPAMAKSQLELAFTVSQGGKQYALPRVQVATGVIGTAALTDVATVTPGVSANAFQRDVVNTYSSDIMFLINQANIRADQRNTNSMDELWAMIKEANANSNQVITDININAYASPDGAWDFNYNLAQNREKNTDSFVREQLRQAKITEFGELTANFTAEDWEGFRTLVEKSNIQDKELIISVLDMYKDPQERETQLRYLSSVFEQLADLILPQLRYSRITASIKTLGKTDEELITLAQANPLALTPEEILYAATLAKDAKTQLQILKSASAAYPNDFRVWNNLGQVQYRLGNIKEAEKSFEKSKKIQNNPEANMNLALIAMNKGDYQRANQLLGQAGNAQNLGEALGTYYLLQGDNAAAANAFADVKSNNAAVAMILTKDYVKARNILDGINSPDAVTFYLKAILGARTNNESMVLNNLRQAVQMNPALAAKAAGDLEFASYNLSALTR